MSFPHLVGFSARSAKRPAGGHAKPDEFEEMATIWRADLALSGTKSRKPTGLSLD